MKIEKDFEIISTFSTTKWKGGSTTELYIVPPTSNYKDLNFDFRLSSASVEIENSEFSFLPGVYRKLMILEGELEIQHENQYSKVLKKFEMDTFNGYWKTTAKGFCTDFNLMTIPNLETDLKAYKLIENQFKNLTFKDNTAWIFLYVYKGKVEVSVLNKNIEISEGTLFKTANKSINNIKIKSLEESELVVTSIRN